MRAPALLAAALIALPQAILAQPAKPKATAAESVKIEATLMSWRAMSQVAAAIARRVNTLTADGSPCVIIVTNADAMTDANIHSMLIEELEALKTEYEKLVSCVRVQVAPQRGTGADALKTQVDALTGLLTSVLGLVQLFQQDINVEGVAVSTDPAALAALVAGRLVQRDKSCGRARLLSLSGGSNLVKKLMEVRAMRLAKLGPCNDTVLVPLDARLKAVVDVLMAEDPGTKRPMAGRLALAQALADAQASVFVLYVSPVVMGGTNLEKTGFFTGGSVSHAGGAAATFVLAKRDGAVLASDTFWSYDGYVRNPTSRRGDASAFRRLGTAP